MCAAANEAGKVQNLGTFQKAMKVALGPARERGIKKLLNIRRLLDRSLAALLE